MSTATRSRNGNSGDTRVAAVQSEQQIADEAAVIRGEAVGMDRALFLKLWPLLRKPIPDGFIKTIGAVTGKPYDSTGISSVQVQIGRMDNVLTPLGWRYSTEYLEAGKVAVVTVQVIDVDGGVLAERDSYGGVDRASTSGNLYKGSYTNAAKLAFARLGPGHEVYIGVTDLDPDVHEGSANAQASVAGTGAGVREQPLKAEAQQKIADAFEAAGIGDRLGLFLTAVGAESIEMVTAAQAYQLRELLDQHIAKAASE